MRLAARLVQPLFRSRIAHGDNLCLLIQRSDGVASVESSSKAKAEMLTAHYG
jgi:hypothetical protein